MTRHEAREKLLAPLKKFNLHACDLLRSLNARSERLRKRIKKST